MEQRRAMAPIGRGVHCGILGAGVQVSAW